MLPISSIMSTIRASSSRHWATGIICAFDNAKQEGHELTQVQQIDALTMMLMSYAEFVAEVELSLVTEEKLRELAVPK